MNKKIKIGKYDVLIISSYVLRYSKQKGYFINITKLMKLLYFIQAKELVENNKKCFNEKILAWEFGPAIYKVFEKYKLMFGINGILTNDDESIDKETKKIIESIVEKYFDKDPMELTYQTHSSGPWKQYWEIDKNSIKNEIPVEEIKKFYSSDKGIKEIE